MQPAAVILIRQPTPADGPAIEEMFARCSLQSRYARFLAPVPTIPADHLARVLTPSTGDEAWVGVTSDEPERVVALGSWSRLGDDAELAIIVEDSWQHRGIGSKVLKMLGERAWSAGACRLTADLLTESRHVLRMLRAIFGPMMSTLATGPTSRVTIERP